MSHYFRLRHFLILLALIVSASIVLSAQEPTQDPQGQKEAAPKSKKSKSKDKAEPQATEEEDPLARPRPSNDKNAIKEKLDGSYKKWLNEDVRWIITDEELSAFKKLSNNAERDVFIEGFWQRRDPTPDTAENEYKEEHYRRIAYANEHFAAGVPGWKTDRGRMYIMYGPPTNIESHPMGGPYQRPPEEGGGTTETYPFEVWRYRYLEAINQQEVEIEFVDDCSCGAYEMTIDRSKKDALLRVPNAGLTSNEELGLSSKTDRFRGGLENLGQGPFNQNQQSKQFDRLETFAKLNAPPPVKFKDLDEVVTHKIRYNLLPFDVQVNFIKLTSETVLVPVTLQVPQRSLVWASKDGVQHAVVNLFGKVSKLSGQTVQTFEETLKKDATPDMLEKEINSTLLYWKALPLKPGLYKLDVVLKDVNGDKLGTYTHNLVVPDFSDDKLSHSSLILADEMEAVPAREIGTGNFVIGMTRVRPRVQPEGKPSNFKRQEKVNFWMQVYNLGMDEKTKKPSATFEYQVINATSNQAVLNFTETTAQLGNVGEQVTLEKSLSLGKLEPGVYQVTIKVNDLVSKQTISPTAKFTVQ